MNTVPVTEDIEVVAEAGERSVIVHSGTCATVIDLPRSKESAQAVLDRAANMAQDGIRAVLLPGQTPLPDGLVGLDNVRIVRPNRVEDDDWAGHPAPPPEFGGPEPGAESFWGSTCGDASHHFVMEPCLGEPTRASVRVLPEDVLVLCDDLRPDMPPRVRVGNVHETIMRLRDLLSHPPAVMIPASGVVLRGEEAAATLDKAIQYLRDLYERTRMGVIESHYPLERLILTIPCCRLWEATESSKPLIDRHRDNVRSVVQEIWQRVQAEADDVTLAS